MITLHVDPMNPDAGQIRIAADAIRRGELVVFPTETAYGLAADAMNESAVKRVYDAKGRPDGRALPVQISGIRDLNKVAEYLPENAKLLAEKYWPGPLTLVLQRSSALPKIVTGEMETVGVRVPDHPVAQALLAELGSPIVATSANVSGEDPPLNAEEAIHQVGESISVVLDAGPSRLGVASTVVDLSTVPPRVLRRGSIGIGEIKDFLGDVEESGD
jgi:L-threonylcarbamoyladenylate synthase